MHPNEQYVRDFFKSWEKGTFSDLCASYRHYLADDVLYENSGVPPCHGSEEAVKLIESVCLVPQDGYPDDHGRYPAHRGHWRRGFYRAGRLALQFRR